MSIPKFWTPVFIAALLCEFPTLSYGTTEGVATALLRSSPSGSGNFHKVQNALKALLFQTFQESASDDLNLGLTVEQFKDKVQALKLARDFGLGDDTKQSILEGQFVEVNKEVVKNFLFKRGEAGKVTQGLIATMKRPDGTIDIGHVIHRLDFQLAPEIIRLEKKKKKLFKKRKKVWYESRMRTLSHRDEELLVSYVGHKLYDVLEHFRQKAHAIGEGTCSAESCH